MKTQVETPRAGMTPERAYERGREDARRNRSFNSVKYKDRSFVAAWERGFSEVKFAKPYQAGTV